MTALGAPPAERIGDDRCPGVLRLHPAQDGGLARIRVPGGRVGAIQLEAIRDAARLGNGLVELTSRANLQVRGLSEPAAARVETLLDGAGLLPSRTHERVRNVVAAPLAGRHPHSIAGTDAVVDALDAGLLADARLAELPGRFLFAVDDGAGLTAAVGADIGLAASPRGFVLELAGRRTDLVAPPAAAAELALAAAHAFLDLRGADWRLSELDDGPARVAGRLGGRVIGAEPDGSGEPASPPTTLAAGALAQRDGRVAVTALPPLGRVEPTALDGLAALLASQGSQPVERDQGGAVMSALTALGLVVSPGSGWEGLSSCAGMGACAKALVAVRARAAVRAAERGPGDPSEHWSGCERRCGEPQDVGIAMFPGGGAP